MQQTGSFIDSDVARRSRHTYFAEAAVEYFIALTASGAFLTMLIRQLGVSDALNGIISNVTALTGGLQVLAVAFIRRRRSIRSTVVVMDLIRHLLYSVLFLLPFLPLPSGTRIALFTVLFLLSAVPQNLVSPVKTNWVMSFVPPESRGIFCSRNEIISLVTGLAYNFGMSRLVDYYDAQGRTVIGLRLCALVIFLLLVIHAFLLLRISDAPQVLAEVQAAPSGSGCMRDVLRSTNFRKLLLTTILWSFFNALTISYYNVFLLQEIGCSITFIAVAGIVSSVVRALVSTPIGRFGDRRGFAYTLELGFGAALATFALMIFWVPANGKVLYLISQVLYCIVSAALNSGMTNVLFQYVPSENRVAGLSLYSAIGGFAAFGGTLAGGVILAAIQGADNTVLGLPLYGQQLLSAIAALGIIVLLFYVRLVIRKMPRVE